MSKKLTDPRSKLDRFLLAVSPFATMILGAWMMMPPEGEITKEDLWIMSGGAFLSITSIAVIAAQTSSKKQR